MVVPRRIERCKVNMARLLGLFVALAGTVYAVIKLAPLIIFFDLISALIVLLACVGLSALTFDDLGWFCKQALPRFFAPDRHDTFGHEQSLHAARIARTIGDHALIVGSIATLIGALQMLQNLEDPSAMGPALAVAFLTNFYAVVIVALFLPMNRFFRSAVDSDHVDALDTRVGVYAQLLSTVVVVIPMGTIYVVMIG